MSQMSMKDFVSPICNQGFYRVWLSLDFGIVWDQPVIFDLSGSLILHPKSISVGISALPDPTELTPGQDQNGT